MLRRGIPFVELPRTYYWLREYMLEKKEANPYGFYLAYKDRPGITYNSIRRIFYVLRQLDVIEFVREEPPGRAGQPKRFYRIKPDKTDLAYWAKAHIRLYPEALLGRRRYRLAKRAGKVPAGREPVGTP